MIIATLILALDPAAAWFDETAEENRMCKDDAQFVDVIHTRSGPLTPREVSIQLLYSNSSES